MTDDKIGREEALRTVREIGERAEAERAAQDPIGVTDNPFDLDALQALHAAARPWHLDDFGVLVDETGAAVFEGCTHLAKADRALILVAFDAVPRLIAA